MLASERSLASAHESQPPQKQAVNRKTKNGTTKPPVRPVKVYVLDPRTLQQRLEAYVGQKKKREIEAEEEKERIAESKKEEEAKQGSTLEAEASSDPNPTINPQPKTLSQGSKIIPSPKQLPPIAPKILNNNKSPSTAPQESSGSTVTLQCTNNFGLSSGSLVVTNGVALLQSPISQSSIQTNGLFLPGVTAISNGPSAIPAPKAKRKVKKRKTGNKKKKSVDKDKEDDDDSELEFLRKETTTRLGRVSRPISQPHSPAFSTMSTAANSRVPSPTRKRKKKSVAVDKVQNQCLTQEQLTTTSPLEAKLNQRKGSSSEACVIPAIVPTLPEHAGPAINVPSEFTISSCTPNQHVARQIQDFVLSASQQTNMNFNQLDEGNQGLLNSRAYTPREESSPQISLVPSSEVQEKQFTCNPTPTNVDLLVPQYSIPSSPPSQCHSPGLPENENINSPEQVCSSPVDPMLLRSRSPFPPPIHEASMHSVGASNLSIPEESLCRGELFMDLGESILVTSANLRERSPFCNNESVADEQLFANSPMKSTSPDRSVEVLPNTETDTDLEPETEKTTHSQVVAPILTTDDANDGEIFQSANFSRNFVHPSITSSVNTTVSKESGVSDCPKTPMSSFLESDQSLDQSEVVDRDRAPIAQKRSVWQFVNEQIQSCGIIQACTEISEVAEKLSRIARDQFIPIREEEIERIENSTPVIHVDTPFFSHLLDLPFGTYIFKEDGGKKKTIPPPPPLTSSDLSFTGGVEDVEKFLPPNIDLIALPHLTNLDLG